MKLVSKILSLIILAGLATFYTSCKSDDGPGKSDAEKQLDKLKAVTWELSEATLDGTARTTDFANLTLTISGTFVTDGTYNYTLAGTTPSRSPWPRSGTWSFGQDPLTQIIRDPSTADETNLDYVVTDTDLVITFTIPTTSDGWDGGSRVNAVSGEWIFTFTAPQ
jgi:hypothetical protein